MSGETISVAFHQAIRWLAVDLAHGWLDHGPCGGHLASAGMCLLGLSTCTGQLYLNVS